MYSVTGAGEPVPNDPNAVVNIFPIVLIASAAQSGYARAYTCGHCRRSNRTRRDPAVNTRGVTSPGRNDRVWTAPGPRRNATENATEAMKTVFEFLNEWNNRQRCAVQKTNDAFHRRHVTTLK